MITFFIIIALVLLYNTCQIWKSSQKWDNLYKPIRSNDLQIADREILPSANTFYHTNYVWSMGGHKMRLEIIVHSA